MPELRSRRLSIARVIGDNRWSDRWRGDKARKRMSSRVIKNTRRKRKGAKARDDNPPGVALLLEATDAMEMSDRRRRGSVGSLLLPFSTLPLVHFPSLRPGHPLPIDKALAAPPNPLESNLSFFLPTRDRATFPRNCRKIIGNRRQASRTRSLSLSLDDEISKLNLLGIAPM